MYRSTNCFRSQKQILRGIKRNYKKIPIIRNNAIKKGIFKVTRPDYKLIDIDGYKLRAKRYLIP